MHSSALTTPTLLLLVLGLAGMVAGSPGCGSTVLEGSGSSAATSGGVGGSGAGTGAASASSGHAASASSSGTGGGHGGAVSGQGGGGTGGGTTCSGAEKLCAGKCVAVDDPAYGCTPTGCAPCATQYANALQACMAGACVLGTCDTGFKNCDGDPANGCEVDTNDDPSNCGACGAPCVTPHATPACNGGTCAIATCDSGWTDCNNDPTDGCEANLQSDPMNCGFCGDDCDPCGPPCVAGQCGLSCAKGTTNCPGDPMDICATMLGTNKNCNFCGDTCNLANATSNCQPNDMPCPAPAFVCTLETCNAGFADCDLVAANGCEVDTQTDANNCGSCGNICPSGPHSTAVCNAGACGITCDPGYFDCNENPIDGCEVNGKADTMNCGGCGDVCNTPNATPGCMGGQCTIVACNAGFADCNLHVNDGCEVNLTQDPQNCGACGTLCSEKNGTAVCAAGICSLGPCNAGFLNCDGKYTSGCYVNGQTDTNNCGNCNNVCSLPEATATCSVGQCQIASCSPGFADCDHKPANGCEVNVTNSTSNCGACGNFCDTPNATPACSNGTCAIAMCNPNFGNCDGNVANGCEVDFMTDDNNCGGCGIKCSSPNGTVTCTNGMCGPICDEPGFADCDHNPTNGCETNIYDDPNNCGGCGFKCNLPNATANCAGGICGVASCAKGYLNCNLFPSDGCEVDTNTDPNNCGVCGNVCATTCSGGVCAP